MLMPGFTCILLQTIAVGAHGTPSGREMLIGWLLVPDVCVALAGVGILLMFAECNMPGAVVPGAAGVLFLLSSVYGFSLLPLSTAALMVLAAAGALLAVAATCAMPAKLSGAIGLLGTLCLICGLSALVRAPHSGVDAAVSIPVGSAVGLSTWWLGRIAVRARRNKTTPAAAA